MDDALTHDAYLGGKLHLWQPAKGYRAGVDPVLLAATVAAKSGQSVLDLGCGVGAAALCLGARIPGLRLSGLEIQPQYAALARRNGAENGQSFTVHDGDLATMPAALRDQQFDHVIANPPYFDRSASTMARDAGRETALGEVTPLSDWIDAAARRVAPKGYVTIIHRAERLPELLSTLNARLGSVELLPLIPRPNRPAQLILLRARKGGRAAFQLHPGLVLHGGIAHDGDRESYTPMVRAALRDGAPLEFS